MTGWFVWQVFSALNPLVFYSALLYALVWSEWTGYNKIREEAMFNHTGIDKRFMHEWKYLTRWNHMIQLFFWFISIFATVQRLYKFKNDKQPNASELIRFIKRPTKLQKFQDGLFHALVHPLAIVITALYWGMKLIDPTLLSATKAQGVPETPPILDHIVHTFVSVSCFFEFFLTFHWRPAWYFNLIGPLALLLVWVLFDEYLKYYHGFAVYNVLSTPLWTLVICLVAIACVCLICLVLCRLHRIYWTENHIDRFQLPPDLRSVNRRSYHA